MQVKLIMKFDGGHCSVEKGMSGL